jgi:hypothetical protein
MTTIEAGGVALCLGVVACALLGIPRRLAVGIYLGIVFSGLIWGLAVQP